MLAKLYEDLKKIKPPCINIGRFFVFLQCMSKLRRNTLLRYKIIRDLYLEHKNPDVPDTVILRKYIYPRFPISRSTLNTVLNTPIERLLAEKQRA